MRVSSEACLDKREAMCVPSDSWKMLFCQQLPSSSPVPTQTPPFPLLKQLSKWVTAQNSSPLLVRFPNCHECQKQVGHRHPKLRSPPSYSRMRDTVTHGEKLLNEFSTHPNNLCTMIWTVLKFTILCGLDFWSFKR